MSPPNYIGLNQIRLFANKNLIMQYFASFSGFFIGLKLVDFVIHDESKYVVQREQLEDEFWAIHGEPKELQPSLVPSHIPGQEGQLRKSWIQITYEKDMHVKGKDYYD